MTTSTAPIATENLAKAIRQVIGCARSEEDLRVGVEHTLGATLQTLRLTATPEYEKTALSGSTDAVYGHAVIEYKRLGRLSEADICVQPDARRLCGDRGGSETQTSKQDLVVQSIDD